MVRNRWNRGRKATSMLSTCVYWKLRNGVGNANILLASIAVTKRRSNAPPAAKRCTSRIGAGPLESPTSHGLCPRRLLQLGDQGLCFVSVHACPGVLCSNGAARSQFLVYTDCALRL